ncbi:unnamed protein product [Pseudo-nitzschia multistriata]|uniref:Uncharacterized protein n=1 Tax=Pseudo-nitzschia multistriata TaxID=183589 RepID=A0A448YX27_9STRA|nr:unnamed protein product [Pseudo-nitzschia multistriata]
MIFICANGISCLDDRRATTAQVSFRCTHLLPVPHPHGGLVGQQNEPAPRIHRRDVHGYLDQLPLLAVFPGPVPEKERFLLCGLDLDKAGRDAPLQVLEAVKAGHKIVGLQALHLPVLDGGPAQDLVGLDHFVGRGSVLVLGRFGSDPDVQVVLQVGRVARGPEDDVGIALEELAVLVLRPGLDAELFDPPDGQSGLGSDALPGVLPLGGGLLDLVVEVGTDCETAQHNGRTQGFVLCCVLARRGEARRGEARRVEPQKKKRRASNERGRENVARKKHQAVRRRREPLAVFGNPAPARWRSTGSLTCRAKPGVGRRGPATEARRGFESTHSGQGSCPSRKFSPAFAWPNVFFCSVGCSVFVPFLVWVWVRGGFVSYLR